MLVIHFFCVFAIAIVKNSNVFEIVLITLFLDLLILTHFSLHMVINNNGNY